MLGTGTTLASPAACPSSYWGVKYSNPSMTPLIRCLCQCLSTTSTVEGQAGNFSMSQRWVAPTLARVIVHSDLGLSVYSSDLRTCTSIVGPFSGSCCGSSGRPANVKGRDGHGRFHAGPRTHGSRGERATTALACHSHLGGCATMVSSSTMEDTHKPQDPKTDRDQTRSQRSNGRAAAEMARRPRTGRVPQLPKAFVL